MKTLRTLHLYLGCVFAPLLAFFAVSGIWQSYYVHWPKPEGTPSALALLSTIHRGRSLKMPQGGVETLSSPLMHGFVVVMALTLIFTMVLGVMMAFRFGRKKSAVCCLAGGVVVPVALILLAAHS